MEELIIAGIQAAVQNTPAIVGAFQKLFASGAPTDSDFATFRATVASKSYADYVPTTLIPADQQIGRPDGSDRVVTTTPPTSSQPPTGKVTPPGTHQLTTDSVSGS